MKQTLVDGRLFASLSAIVLALAIVTPARAQHREQATVGEAIQVMNEIMRVPASAIPRRMLEDAQAVAIIPRVLKGSFVVGARHGRGVVIARDDSGHWQAPVFVTLTGGNVGWQVGIQSTDVILVFKTKTSVQSMFNGKLTIGADAAAAAGPVGRNAAAATDGRLQAEIYSYSRSRGLFAGVSIDGSVLKIDPFANSVYYRSPGLGQPAHVPQLAQQLVHTVMTYTGELNQVPADPAGNFPSASPQLAQRHSQHQSDAIRDELARFAPQLFQLLDKSWQSYLALPAEIFNGTSHPTPIALSDCVARYETVRNDPKYRMLAERPEFQSIYGLLKHYQQARADLTPELSLPDPPPGNR